jgi:two-component system, NarL family, invasion response regulator UvrY
MALSKIKVAIVDDHEDMLSIFKDILEPEFDVVAAVRTGRALLKSLKEIKPDIIIVDINMPEMSGFELTRKILQEDIEARIILLSAHKDRQIVEEGFSSGAKGFVLKHTAYEDLVDAVSKIIHGNSYVSPSI